MKSNEKIVMLDICGRRIPAIARKEGKIEVIDEPESVQRIVNVFEEERNRQEKRDKCIALSAVLFFAFFIWFIWYY